MSQTVVSQGPSVWENQPSKGGRNLLHDKMGSIHSLSFRRNVSF